MKVNYHKILDSNYDSLIKRDTLLYSPLFYDTLKLTEKSGIQNKQNQCTLITRTLNWGHEKRSRHNAVSSCKTDLSVLPHKWALCAVVSHLNSRMRPQMPYPCIVYRKISHGGVYWPSTWGVYAAHDELSAFSESALFLAILLMTATHY